MLGISLFVLECESVGTSKPSNLGIWYSSVMSGAIQQLDDKIHYCPNVITVFICIAM
jgi:hypothetical protein